MKHIVDGLGYQEACNGIKCIDCPFLDNEHNCKIGMYIRSQKVYQERPHGEWLPTDEIGYVVRCSLCSYRTCADVAEKEFKFCPNCGADMREGDENDRE